jgi:hypothetical protein
MLRIRHDSRATPAPSAPRLNPCPLPDIGTMPTPTAKSAPPVTPRPSASHRHRRLGSIDESGYSSSLESTLPRGRPSSQAVRTPLVPSPPLKGILKTGMGVDPKTRIADVIVFIVNDRKLRVLGDLQGILGAAGPGWLYFVS